MKTLTKILIGVGFITGFGFYSKALHYQNDNKLKEISGTLGYTLMGSIAIGGGITGAKKYEEKNKTYDFGSDLK